jgi:hypothetical protein
MYTPAVRVLGVGEAGTKHPDTSLGLCGEHVSEGLPYLCGMLETKNIGEYIRGQSFEQVTYDLLIPRNPNAIGWIGDGDLLLGLIFNLQSFWRRRVGAVKQPHDLRSSQGGQHLRLPQEMILPRELVGWWCSKGRRQRGHGRGGRHREGGR